MALLSSKDAIFARGARRYEVVKVPELGDDAEVRLQSLTGDEWEEYENSLYHQVKRRDGAVEVKINNRHKRAKLIARCVVDAAGQLVFDPQKDVLRLSNMDAGALDRIFEVCQTLSGQGADAEEEAEENFGEAPDGPSTTGSPSPSAAAPSTNSSPESQPVS